MPLTVALLSVGIAVVLPLVLTRPEYGLFFLVALLPLREFYLVSALSFQRLMIWSLFGYTLLRRVTFPSRKTAGARLSWFTISMVLFIIALGVALLKTAAVLYSSYSLTSSTLKSAIFSNTLIIVENLLLVYIVYYMLESRWQIQQLLAVLFSVSAVIASLGILQYVTQGNVGYLNVVVDPGYPFYGRATSVFPSPNNLGHFLSPVFGMAFVAVVWGPVNLKTRLGVLLPILVLDGLAILLSFSRGAMLQVFFGLFLVAALYYIKIARGRLSWKVILVAGLIAGAIFAAFQYYDIYLRARLSVYQGNDYRAALQWIKNTSDYGRKRAAIATFQTFLRHPVLGVGYDTVSAKYIPKSLAPDNQYLKIMAEMGLFGFVPFAVLLGIVIKAGLAIWEKRRPSPASPETQILMLLLLSGFGTVLFSYLFADTLHSRAISGNLWIFAGAILALERQANAGNEADQAQ